jgi:hypothetical protein
VFQALSDEPLDAALGLAVVNLPIFDDPIAAEFVFVTTEVLEHWFA